MQIKLNLASEIACYSVQGILYCARDLGGCAFSSPRELRPVSPLPVGDADG